MEALMFGRAHHARVRRRQQPIVSALRQLCVTVYLATEPHAMLRGCPPGMTLVLTDRFVINVSARDTDVEILHNIFEPSFDDRAVSEHANAARDGLPGTYDHRTRRGYSPERRRLMVGDIVALGPRHYACTALGWLHVLPPG
ncbi:hypothetical protein BOX37_27900 [Nocardia mangyaensis]|jgi:hypothetical protein|uniref:Uncharacterized protein n=1 Tax=Nocardia mangyaensis TaxID=2213200 RepID=A0A1J0VYN4_9NOCA|nr:hypothetical protein [Nocardia mangyaensis]APE37118.1 hypothetical protein BOX37_27900 [Nocardia mangyaensis]